MLTEGLLNYLTHQTVTDLAHAFNRPEIRWWITDITWGPPTPTSHPPATTRRGSIPPTASDSSRNPGGKRSQWTIFYWAWWISWTPFVGMFIARISRGRTIRQFVTGVLVAPSVVSLVWFVIFGGAAIFQQRETHDLTESDGSVDSNFALFHLLDHYPLASVTAALVMVLVAIFFVSGASTDAASIVMGTLSERGRLEPSKFTVAFWGAATGAVAAIMLIIADIADLGGALNGLQALTTVVSLPFAVVMGLLCVALYRDVRTDPIILREDRGVELVTVAVVQGSERHDSDFELVTTPVLEQSGQQQNPGTSRDLI